jgi:uncharacterized membrane protein (UPF0127 family)
MDCAERYASARMRAMTARELEGGLRVAEARSWAERTRGLARRDDLPADEALHLLRCRSVHTFGMRFALDLVWLGADGLPVRVDRDVRPRRLRTCLRARSVVECNAGRADAFLAAGL